MSSTRAVVAASVTTILFAGTLGVLIAVAGFGIIRVLDQMLEAISVIPMRWGENHIDTLMEIAAVVSFPVVVWFSLWFFRKAVRTEIRLADYQYDPPE